MDGPAASHAKITIHRNGSIARSSTRASSLRRIKSGSTRSNSTYSRRGGRGYHIAKLTGLRSSRRSLASIKSAGSTPHKQPASRPRRGVNFSHLHGNSFRQSWRGVKRGPASIAGDDTTYSRDHTSPSSPCRQPRPSTARCSAPPKTQSMSSAISKGTHSYWNDELRQLSHSIAKDCDEAFSSSLLSPGSYIDDEIAVESSNLDSSMVDCTIDTGYLSTYMDTPTPPGFMSREPKRDTHKWDTRPLPLAPPPTDSVLHEIMLAKKRTAKRESMIDESPGHVDRMLQHLDKLIPTSGSEVDENRRAASAPIYSQYSTQWGKGTIPLPSILESHQEPSTSKTRQQRVISAPVGETPVAKSTQNFGHEKRGPGLDYLSRQENTIRMVMSPSNMQSPVKAPAPLNVRKKLSRGVTTYPQPRKELDLRQKYSFDKVKETVPDASTQLPGNQVDPVRKKSSWFKRASKDKNDVSSSKASSNANHIDRGPQVEDVISTNLTAPPTKKKSFSLAFWKNTRHPEQMKLSVAGKIVTCS